MPHHPQGPVDSSHSAYAYWQTLPMGDVLLTAGFWAERQAVNRCVTLRHGYEMLEDAGNFHGLRLAAGDEVDDSLHATPLRFAGKKPSDLILGLAGTDNPCSAVHRLGAQPAQRSKTCALLRCQVGASERSVAPG